MTAAGGLGRELRQERRDGHDKPSTDLRSRIRSALPGLLLESGRRAEAAAAAFRPGPATKQRSAKLFMT